MSIVALICLVLAGLCALAYLPRLAGAPPSLRKSVIKTASVVLLVPVAAGSGAPGWIVVGLALGAAGDLSLSRPGARAFLIGMVAFAAGHLAYLVAFVQLGAGWPGLAAALALAALGLLIEIRVGPRTGALRMPVRGYILVIVAMALAALGLPAAHWPLVLGALLFVLSDAILAFETFVMADGPRRRLAARALWVCYWSGQALIAAGPAVAALFLGPAIA